MKLAKETKLKNTIPETAVCYGEEVEEIAFPENRVRPLVKRIREFGPYRLSEKAQGWWETEDNGFVMLVAWNRDSQESWEFFLRWECEEQKGASGLYIIKADDPERAMEQLIPAMETLLMTPVGRSNGNGNHPEK